MKYRIKWLSIFQKYLNKIDVSIYSYQKNNSPIKIRNRFSMSYQDILEKIIKKRDKSIIEKSKNIDNL